MYAVKNMTAKTTNRRLFYNSVSHSFYPLLQAEKLKEMPMRLTSILKTKKINLWQKYLPTAGRLMLLLKTILQMHYSSNNRNEALTQ
jgi:hypothetical protein